MKKKIIGTGIFCVFVAAIMLLYAFVLREADKAPMPVYDTAQTGEAD